MVGIKPKPPFRPIFQVATTRKGSGVTLGKDQPPEEHPGAEPCSWWRRGRVELPVQKSPRQNFYERSRCLVSRLAVAHPASRGLASRCVLGARIGVGTAAPRFSVARPSSSRRDSSGRGPFRRPPGRVRDRRLLVCHRIYEGDGVLGSRSRQVLPLSIPRVPISDPAIIHPERAFGITPALAWPGACAVPPPAGRWPGAYRTSCARGPAPAPPWRGAA